MPLPSRLTDKPDEKEREHKIEKENKQEKDNKDGVENTAETTSPLPVTGECVCIWL